MPTMERTKRSRPGRMLHFWCPNELADAIESDADRNQWSVAQQIRKELGVPRKLEELPKAPILATVPTKKQPAA